MNRQVVYDSVGPVDPELHEQAALSRVCPKTPAENAKNRENQGEAF